MDSSTSKTSDPGGSSAFTPSSAVPPFMGFTTAGKQTTVGVSEAALKAVRATMQASDSSPQPMFSDDDVFSKEDDNVFISAKSDASWISGAGSAANFGFQTAGGTTVTVDQKALEAVREQLQSTDETTLLENGPAPSAAAFVQASTGTPLQVKNSVLHKVSKRFLEVEENTENGATPESNLKRFRENRLNSTENTGFVSPLRRISTEPNLGGPSTPASGPKRGFRSPLVAGATPKLSAPSPLAAPFPSTSKMDNSVTIPAAIYDEYAKDGRIHLSSGFIQRFFQGNDDLTERPILQITRIRQVNRKDTNGNVARVELNDGYFIYNCGLVSEFLEDKIQQDKLGQDGKLAVIVVKTFGDRYSFNIHEKIPVVIVDYDLVCLTDERYGEPIYHSGNPASHLDDDTRVDVSFPVQRGPGPPQPTKRPATNNNPDAENVSPVKNPRLSGAQRLHLGDQHTTPINMISPYLQKWRIKGVVTHKEDLKTVKGRAGGDMKVFNFTLTDENGDSIRLASFADVAEKFYSIIQMELTFYVSGGTIKQANPKFNTTGHMWEITLRRESEVSPCTDTDRLRPPPLKMKSVRLNELESHNEEVVDVLAVIHSVGEVQEFKSKAGKDLVKRTIQLVDPSLCDAQLTLWGDQAKNFDAALREQVVAIKNVKVTSFQGVMQLVLNSSSLFAPSPSDLPEATEVQTWYSVLGGQDMDFKSNVTPVTQSFGFAKDFRLLGAVVETNAGRDESAYFNILGWVTVVKTENPYYAACPTAPACKKKVVQSGDSFYCDKCKVNYDNSKMLYMLQVEVADSTGSVWVSMFDEVAEKFLGKTANDLADIRDSNEDEYQAIFNAICFQFYTFRIRASSDSFNNELRIRYQVQSTDPAPFATATKIVEELLPKLEAVI